MLKRIGFVITMFHALFVGEVIQAAEEASRESGTRAGILLHRAKASLYQIENEGDYIFVVHAFATPIANGSPLLFAGERIEGRKVRLFKGPIDDLRELSCSTGFASGGSETFFHIKSKIGTLLVDKK